MRKEVDMDCLTPSNSTPYKHGYTQNIQEIVERNFGDDRFKDLYGKELESVLELSKSFQCENEWEEKSKTLEIVGLEEIKDQLATNSHDIRMQKKNRAGLKNNKDDTKNESRTVVTDSDFANTGVSTTRSEVSNKKAGGYVAKSYKKKDTDSKRPLKETFHKV
jgi:hypothetical protein